MSFTTRTIAIIGVLAIVVAGGCLLWEQSQEKTVSYTPSVSSVAAASSTTSPDSQAATTAPAISQKVVPTNTYDFATVGGITFEIATSTAKQQQGLGDRETIPDNYAMLFVFNRDNTYGFWMKDMLEPLDMIWLSDNGAIVAITHDATPASYPNVFYPPIPIRYVLETRVGLAAEKSWAVGTRIPLPLPYGE